MSALISSGLIPRGLPRNNGSTGSPRTDLPSPVRPELVEGSKYIAACCDVNLFILLFLFFPVSGMQFPLDKHLAGWVDKKEYNAALAKLDTTVDANIIKHLMLNDNHRDTTQNLKHFFSVNKALRALSGNIHLTAFIITLLVKHKEMPFIAAALQLATPGAHALVSFINKTDPESYGQALTLSSKSPHAVKALRGLIAYDTKSLAFQGLPRITPLMIAVGCKNEEGVNILIAAAKKRGILSTYLNMQCPKGTSTCDEWFATDSEFDFILI